MSSWSMVRRACLVGVMVSGSNGALAQDTCRDGASRQLVVELLMGRNIGARPGVSEAGFQAFLSREVTPRFPDGFTVFDSRGQFRDARGAIIKERGKVMLIALGDEARDWPRIQEIVARYKERFRQQSVGVISRAACVAF